MTGPAAWDDLRVRLAHAVDALAKAKADLETVRISAAAAARALAALHVDEEELDERRRDAVDVLGILELYRQGDTAAGLDRLSRSAREELARISAPLLGPDVGYAFVLARAFVDTIAVSLLETERSYDEEDDESALTAAQALEKARS